jgi:hypothetical protein
MYIALMGCAQQGSAAPLAAQIDSTAPIYDVVDVVGSATGSVVTFTNQGGFDISVVASGGTGVYTYSWNAVKVSENSDAGGPYFSVNTLGTTNAARYNTLTVDGARPASDLDPPFDAEFDVTCTVDDGVSQVTTGTLFICNGVTVP